MGNAHTVQCAPVVISKQDANNNMKRTCERISLRRIKMSLPQTNKSHRKKNLLKAMPRCSSFEDLTSIEPSPVNVDIDPTYILWKRSFEHPREKPDSVKQDQMKRMKRRVHNMTSAISGHITPKGFPSHINLKAFSIKHYPQYGLKQKQHIKNKSSQLTKLNGITLTNKKIHEIQSNQNKSSKQTVNIHPYQPSSIANVRNSNPDCGSKGSTHSKHDLSSFNLLSKLSRNKQALIIERLFRDIKTFESYYDPKVDSLII